LPEVSPTLFDLLDQYSAEIEAGRVRSTSRVWSSSIAITFCQNAFNQFFDQEFDHQITGFDDEDARKAAPFRRSEGKSAESRAVVAQYVQFCREYPDIIGAGYGSSHGASVRFHLRTLRRLVERLHSWANADGTPALAERIEQSLNRYVAAVTAAKW
jgi:hypothetical protein